MYSDVNTVITIMVNLCSFTIDITQLQMRQHELLLLKWLWYVQDRHIPKILEYNLDFYIPCSESLLNVLQESNLNRHGKWIRPLQRMFICSKYISTVLLLKLCSDDEFISLYECIRTEWVCPTESPQNWLFSIWNWHIFRDSLFVRYLNPSNWILPVKCAQYIQLPNPLQSTLMAFISTTNFTFPSYSSLLKCYIKQGTVGNNRLKKKVF